MTDTTKKFYVYVHKYASGPKTGQVFYVGKGQGRRYLSKKGRNDYWIRIVAKYGYTSDKLISFHNEACALSFEVALISLYGRGSLCNMTNGGDGSSGYTHTECALQKMRDREPVSLDCVARGKISEYMMGNNHCVGRVASDATRLKMSEWQRHPNIYEFYHPDHGSAVSTKYDLRIKYDLCSSGLSAITTGKLKTHKGWSFIREVLDY